MKENSQKKQSNEKYDLIVVGGGHAGVEAAVASAKMGNKTLMFVIKLESIGRMSCNPSVGGPAKGHLAREIDALGGVIGLAADSTGIQFRMLNRGKGPAVWAPRVQNDRSEYSTFMRNICEKQENLNIIESTIDSIIVKNRIVKGVKSSLEKNYFAEKVILANGTFLKGLVHVGKKSYSGGRSGEPSSENLSKSLIKNKIELKRFKTGTPPRIDLRSLDLNQLKEQKGDPNPSGFSFYNDIELKNSASCFLTFTNQKTHDIIRNNLRYSSLYSGRIKGVGPRYCPSVEDKVVKFADKQSHQVFIEPEGLNTFEGYVNGMSNSLPPNVQEDFLHSIVGLEKAKIIRYAYAIEYDYAPPQQLFPTLESKKIKGLYFAGQINGTSGYEEAAAQGIVAAINATCSLNGKKEIIFDRSISYIGVLIDDLVTKGTNEPYRMFTSRAEYRLNLRQDNADERLMPLGYKLGLVPKDRYEKFLKFYAKVEKQLKYLTKTTSSNHPQLNEPTKLINILKRSNIKFDDLKEYGYLSPPNLSERAKQIISLKIKYSGYLTRQLADIKRFKSMENTVLSKDLNYLCISTIRYEAREKMQKIKPVSIGQASRISGVNFTDITALLIYLKKRENSK